LGSAEGGLWVTKDGGQSWTPLTDFEPSLAVGSIALDPTTNPTTIYIGTGEQGFKGEFPPQIAANDSYYGAGVLKSTDGGKTWTQDRTFSNLSNTASSTASGPYIGSIAIAPDNNQILLAAIRSTGNPNLPAGIWRSTDGGASWAPVLPEAAAFSGDVPAGTSIVFNPAIHGEVFVALGDPLGNPANGIYQSNDDGATWTLVGTNPSFGNAKLALSPPTTTTTGYLLAAVANASTSSGDLLGVYTAPISTSGVLGAFTQIVNPTTGPDFCKKQCWYDMALGVSPTNPNVIYLGGANSSGGDVLTVSTDGGTTWSPDLYAGNNGSTVNTSGQLHTDTHAIAFSPDGAVLAVGNDGGVWTTTNVGVSSNVVWNDLNQTLAITQFYPGISIFPGNPSGGLGGTQDNGTQFYSGSLQWQQIPPCGDGGYTAINFAATILYYACAADEGVWEANGTSNPPSLTWAGNGIGTCTTTVTSLNSNCYHAYFVPPLVMDPQNSSILYFGAQAPSGTAQVVYQTTNGAQTWQPISPDLSGSNNPNFPVTTIAVAPTNSNVVYAATFNGKVWTTANALAGAGSVWQEGDSGLPGRTPTDIVADPSSPTTAYVSYSGFSSCSACDHLGHIFATTNGGTSWVSITGNLPDVPVNALVVDPAVTSTIYAATDVGVFATTDGGSTWTPLVTGLPNVAVLGLTLDPPTRTLWAGTHGRSMWALQLPQPPTATPSPAALAFANQDVGTTSAAQTVTLSNTGGMALAISSITVAAPYSQTNTCGTSLAAGASCTINVTFSPTVAGNAPATLTIADNLRSGPVTIALSGAGQDFAVASSPSTASVSAGSSASFTISVAPQGGVGFVDPVSLACSGLPSQATCTFSPATVTPGSGTATSTLTISTTAPSSMFPVARRKNPGRPLLIVLWLGLFLTSAAAAFVTKNGGRKFGLAIASCALLACLAATTVSCGGGGSSAPRNPGTPPGTYSVTVTGTSKQLQHSATITLTVHQP
ncbi:MAG TPA: choice-of-anchor D domain-containing protein, partial [Acidobacteriaceae bacterium]|nr:choice-of-anchor D domain-containing protein [Acidobacteriaceae bacterium]